MNYKIKNTHIYSLTVWFFTIIISSIFCIIIENEEYRTEMLVVMIVIGFIYSLPAATLFFIANYHFNKRNTNFKINTALAGSLLLLITSIVIFQKELIEGSLLYYFFCYLFTGNVLVFLIPFKNNGESIEQDQEVIF